jgi:hypothetical protein
MCWYHQLGEKGKERKKKETETKNYAATSSLFFLVYCTIVFFFAASIPAEPKHKEWEENVRDNHAFQ